MRLEVSAGKVICPWIGEAVFIKEVCYPAEYDGDEKYDGHHDCSYYDGHPKDSDKIMFCGYPESERAEEEKDKGASEFDAGGSAT